VSGKSGGMAGFDSPAREGTSVAFPAEQVTKSFPDEPVMVDLGSVLNGYHMDETRMSDRFHT
jgi:Xaa-Pro aminopeptidase